MPGVTTILFDNDGVLVNTEHLFFEACREMLEPFGVDLTEALFAEYSLTRGVTPLEIACERGLVAREAFAENLARRDDRYSELLRSRDTLMPAARETVLALAPHFRIGVVTSAKRRHFELTHARTGLLERFEFAYTREDYRRSKPHPDPYRLALNAQQLSAEECVVVEDTPRGLAAARAAGIPCYVVPNPMARDTHFEGALAVLDSIDALPAQLAGTRAPPDAG